MGTLTIHLSESKEEIETSILKTTSVFEILKI